MSRSTPRSLLLCALLAFLGMLGAARARLLAARHAAPTTKGERFQGYTFMSNVTDWQDLSLDHCEMLNVALTGNYVLARSIYYNGSNALPLTFYDLAISEVSQGLTLYNLLFSGLTFKSPTDVNQFLLDAITRAQTTGNPTIMHKALLAIVRGKALFDALDQAVVAPTEHGMENYIDIAWALFTGKPGVAAHVGGPSGGCVDNLFTVFKEFDNVFYLSYRNESVLDLYMEELYSNAKYAASKKNSTGVKDAALSIASTYVEFLLQFILYDGLSIDMAAACHIPAMSTEATTQSSGMLDMVMNVLYGMGGPRDAILALNTTIRGGSAGFAATKSAIAAAIAGTGIFIDNIAHGGSQPDIAALKESWFESYGPEFDVRNCTAF